MAIAKKRMLSPTIWDDENFNKLSYPARLLFIGLVSIADDEGRGRADVEYLRKTLFGYDKIDLKDVEKWLKSLKKSFKSVKIYKKNGKKYYQLLNWNEYQHIRSDRYTPSKIPFFRYTKCQPSGIPSVNQASTKCRHRLDKIRLDKIKEEGNNNNKFIKLWKTFKKNHFKWEK
jgi:hypothetical protein